METVRPRLGRCVRWTVVGLLSWVAGSVGFAGASWQVVRGDFFDIYSDARTDDAIDTAVWLEQFRRVVGTLWKIDPRTVSRARVVLFRSEREFSEYRDGKYIAGFFFDNDLASVMALHRGSEGARQTVQHECVHWLMGGMRERLPVWLKEGMAEVYSTFEMEHDRCTLFQAEPANLGWLQLNGVNSLRGVVLSERDDIDYDDPDRVASFYAQSWALVHYLLCGTRAHDGGASIARFVDLRSHGREIDQAFTEAFGCDFEALQERLRTYVRGGRYRIVHLPYDRENLRASFHAEPAAEVEVACALGLLRLGGRTDLDGAERKFRAAREGAPESPLPWEGLGCVAYARGDRRQAAKCFGEAAARGSSHPYAYYLPAAMELDDRLGSDPTSYYLRPKDARRLSDAFMRALQLDPKLEHAPDKLGLALLFTEPLQTQEVQFLSDQVKTARYPGVVVYRVAGLLHRFGDGRVPGLLRQLANLKRNPALQKAAVADLEQLEKEKPAVRIGARPVHPAPVRAPLRIKLELPR